MIFLGVTGRGKTTGARHFLRYLVARHLVDVVLIHDVKKSTPQYEGEVIHDPRRIYVDPPKEYPAVRVLRRRSLDHMPKVESAARVTLEMGYDDVRALFILDEFQRGLTDGGRFESPSLRRLFCEGLGMHASVIATKQLPQNIPTEATGQSTIVYFGSTTEGVNYLIDERKVTREQAEIMLRLPVGRFMVKMDEGEFLPGVFEVPADAAAR